MNKPEILTAGPLPAQGKPKLENGFTTQEPPKKWESGRRAMNFQVERAENVGKGLETGEYEETYSLSTCN